MLISHQGGPPAFLPERARRGGRRASRFRRGRPWLALAGGAVPPWAGLPAGPPADRLVGDGRQPGGCCVAVGSRRGGCVVGQPAPAAGGEITARPCRLARQRGEVISRVYRGEKRLVFCDSRTKVERLASALRSQASTPSCRTAPLASMSAAGPKRLSRQARLRHRRDKHAGAWDRRRRPGPGRPDQRPVHGILVSPAHGPNGSPHWQ